MNRSPLPVILIADDDEKIVYAFKKTFQDFGRVISASNGEEAIEKIVSEKPSIVFLDITMPVKDGLSVLREITVAGIKIPVIIITGYGTMGTAIDAMKLGAFDYITKPLDIKNLRLVASRALEMVRLKREVKDLKSALVETYEKDEIIGSHPVMQEIFKKIGMIAKTPNPTNVFISGQSGTGKELVAKAIHKAGANSKEPFLAINCTVLPENLLESELFGHERGAFTGAVKQKKGKFEVVGAGTIFLDEIGDMTTQLQQKFLRVLEEREFSTIGGHRRVMVNARFITATNQDLKTLIQKGEFREDLFYRLNVFHIHLPPLHERKDDIPNLVNFFITQQNKALNKHIKAVADDAMQHLMAFNYPGNVRELKNIIISAITQEKGDVLTIRSLPRYIFMDKASLEYNIPIGSLKMKQARRQVINVFEEQFVRHILKLTGGHVTRAADLAGIERQSLQRLMRRHKIRSEDFKTTG